MPGVNDILSKYGMQGGPQGMPQQVQRLRDLQGTGLSLGRVQQAQLPGQIRPLGQTDMASARQGLVGPLQSMMQRTPGRPVGTATGMGMTPPSQGAFNPMFNNLNRGGGMPFDRQNADGIMRKYRMGGVM